MSCEAQTTSEADSIDSTLIALEKQSWVAWKEHDAAFFSRFLSADHVEVHGDGPSNRATVVIGVASPVCTVKSYALDHFNVTRFDAGTALLTYRAEQDTTCGSARVPSPVWASSLYLMRDGRWQNAFYAHSAIPVR